MPSNKPPPIIGIRVAFYLHRFVRWFILKQNIMKNKLISMVDMVLSHDNRHPTIAKDAMKYCGIFDYAIFLNTPLNISMFVPAIKVGDKWEVLEMPKRFHEFINTTWGNLSIMSNDEHSEIIQYRTAKDKVIFEGFELIFDTHLSNGNSEINIKNLKESTIEYLIEFDVYLTAYGMEQSGLNK